MLRNYRLIPWRKPPASKALFKEHINAIGCAHLALAPNIKSIVVANRGRLSTGKSLGRCKRLHFCVRCSYFNTTRLLNIFLGIYYLKLGKRRLLKMRPQIMCSKTHIIRCSFVNNNNRICLPFFGKTQFLFFCREYTFANKTKNAHKSNFVKNFALHILLHPSTGTESFLLISTNNIITILCGQPTQGTT